MIYYILYILSGTYILVYSIYVPDIIYHNRLYYDTVLFVNMLCSSFFSKSRKYIKLLLILNPSSIYLLINLSEFSVKYRYVSQYTSTLLLFRIYYFYSLELSIQYLTAIFCSRTLRRETELLKDVYSYLTQTEWQKEQSKEIYICYNLLNVV